MSCRLLNLKNKSILAKEKTSAFGQIDFKDDGIYVELKNESYRLLKMDTLEISKIVNLYENNYYNKWQQRFSEDFVEYSNKLDIYPKQQELFTLEDSKGNVKLLKLKFTSKKRSQAKDHYDSAYDQKINLNKDLTKQEAFEDLNQLEQLISEKYSYAFLNGVNVSQEIQKLKNEIEDGITTYDLAIVIGRFINKFGDGHSRIHNVRFKKNGVLPFSVKSFNGKVVCIKDDKLLNNEYPFLHTINGVELTKLLEISEEYLTPDASPQFKERIKVAKLNRIGEILRIAGSLDRLLNVELISKDGQIISLIMEMEEDNRRQDNTPFEVKHFEDIGYLRIKSMVGLDGENSLQSTINELRNKKGLIIDVRNNGGGLRDILLELAPHFISKKQGFVVGNVAQLRTDKISKNHNLSDRFLYQIDDDYFNENMKANLKDWSSKFSKSISLEDGLYSSDYFLYVGSHDEPYFSNTPTVVLLNEGCFSATDIFLSTFKEIDDVTLIGTSSGGGSGRSKRYKLNNSLIEVRLSSIVSFQPNGSLYDGIGVSPDVEVFQSGISDLLKESDSQLEFALKFLNKNE
jgi:C-terminal processing protease CtpA/Prc